jgi:quinolinate synthase
MSKSILLEEIQKLKNEKNASILAHYYQEGDIQDIADVVADSLGLAQSGKLSNSDVLLVAGVFFMGETAKILSPEKIVLVPDLNAGCSLADNCPASEFKKFCEAHPDHTVVTYVNCSAEVKALSDILCTSSNAVKIINSIPKDKKIIFAPDKHLGNYLIKMTGRDLLLWDGACIVHENFEAKNLIKLQLQHPNAQVLAHPECPMALLDMADHIGSTSALLQYAIKSEHNEFIVATEAGIIHQMEKSCPNKTFIPLSNKAGCNCAECPYMRLNTLEKIRNALRDLQPRVEVPEDIRTKAVLPLERMLKLSA